MALSDIDLMLVDAAKNGDNLRVEKALKNGADIDAKDGLAIRLAAQLGHTKTVEMLIDRGADIHATKESMAYWAVKNEHKDMVLLLLRHDSGSLILSEDGNKLDEWLPELQQETSAYFQSEKLSREQCFTAGKVDDKVLDACVTNQFTTLIGAPLIVSAAKADRKLFQDIWEALPAHWQDQNQNIYMQFIKEGGTQPFVGQHTGSTQRALTDSSLAGR